MKGKLKKTQIPLNFVMMLLLLACLLPFILLIVSSFTDEKTLLANGYNFFPSQFSLKAYAYLGTQFQMLARSFLISVFSTVVGTVVSLVITTSLAYVLSRRDYPIRNVLSFAVFFTMLFNGGLVPTYLMYTQGLGIKNTVFALIIPSLLMNGFNVMIMKAYFSSNTPDEVRESAYVDGAGEFRAFFQVVIPLAVPIIATIGLLTGISYWNDWMNGLYYLTDSRLFSLQNVLNRILTDAQFLSTNSFGTQTGDMISKVPTSAVRMAIAVIGVVPVMLAYPFFQKYFVRGISIGAVKG